MSALQWVLVAVLGSFLFMIYLYLLAKLWRFGTLQGEQDFRDYQRKQRQNFHDSKTPTQEGD